MRKIKEVLRLRYGLNKSQREISRICRVGKTTVQDYLRRARAASLSWPVAKDMSEEQLSRQLFPAEPASRKVKAEIPFRYIFEELKRPHVTLSLLWEEYKRENPEGYQCSWFSEQVRNYLRRVNYSMRQEHKAGEKGFLDFGTGMDIIDRATGKAVKTEIFVFVWGASKKTYAQAVLREDKATWIRANVNALEYFGCCPKALVPDNLKSAVTSSCRYEPEINRTYEEFAEHYQTAILPARSRKPKDKALAENGVKLGKRWILARLRNRTFYSLAEMNAAIRTEADNLNSREMKRIGKSRQELFVSLDKPNALPVPEKPYEYAEWKKAKVNINYHICFEKHDYSVPYTYIHRDVEIRATVNVVQVYFKGKRLCSHRRSSVQNAYTTVKEHMPPAHQKYLEWTPERIMSWAQKYGPAVEKLVGRIMSSRRFPEQAYKRCLGIIRLEKRYTAERLNLACKRALEYKIYSYRGVRSILENALEDRREQETGSKEPFVHENIRGSGYFATDLFPEDVQAEQKCTA